MNHFFSSSSSLQAVDDEDSPGPNTNVIYSFTVSASSPNTNTTRAEEHFAVDSLTGQFSCSPINHEENFHTITIQAIATDQGTNPGPQNSTALVQITVEVSTAFELICLCHIL